MVLLSWNGLKDKKRLGLVDLKNGICLGKYDLDLAPLGIFPFSAAVFSRDGTTATAFHFDPVPVEECILLSFHQSDYVGLHGQALR